MKRFKSILLVDDQDIHGEAALRRAAALARQNDARLTVVAVVEDIPRDMRMLITTITPREVMNLVVAERQEQLEQFVAPIRHDDIRLGTTVLSGTPFLEIIREVLRKKHDLVVMTAERSGGLTEQLFGSTSLHLMRKCPCPIWVLKHQPRERFERIIAAVDPDPDDQVKNALNAKILDLATSLAEQEQSELHIVHVWSFAGIESGRRYGLPDRQAEQCLEAVRGQRRNDLDALLGRYVLAHLNHRVHLKQGNAGIVIPELVRAAQVELIVMGTVCRTGLPGFFIGNTAETILQQVDCSVLTVKPEGFLSPVTLGAS